MVGAANQQAYGGSPYGTNAWGSTPPPMAGTWAFRRGPGPPTSAGCRPPWVAGCWRRPGLRPAHNRPMDDIVRQAIAKWPNVPHCFGWLGLDMRGQWFLRDDHAQAQGPFAAARRGAAQSSKGALLQHDKLIGFIGRNYEADAAGQWFFQNGPQRVYVELEATPWVWRLTPADQGPH